MTRNDIVTAIGTGSEVELQKGSPGYGRLVTFESEVEVASLFETIGRSIGSTTCE
jgi:hypothetical protein